ncbi:Hypothetical predicted protein [Paramuricea clavata]|uniref:Uncharacterized protein n=1 Tax=Paramuricea clavata TaxID=317549 RepID=A0A7D9EE74_PARCT|nr:Hypothetical predicted protein [Paramuricea clavata]
MRNDHTGPLDPAGHPGLPDRTCNSSSATVIIFFNTRDCVGARGNSSSTIPKARIYKFYLCGAQEGWGESSGSKSKTTEPVSSLRAFQDGGHPHVKGSIKEGRFSRENRPQGCLPDSANLEEPPKISSVSLEGHRAGVCMPSFRLATAPRVFTKLMKPVVGALRQRGIRLIIYLDDILIMAESHDLALHHAAPTLNLLGARLHSKLPEVTTKRWNF